MIRRPNRYRHLRDLRGRIGLFAEWATRKGIGVASGVTLEVAELFVRHLRHELRLQDRTVKNYVTAVGSMFAWGQRRQPPLVAENPFACGRNGPLRIVGGPTPTQAEEERYQTYAPEQVEALVSQALAAGDVQIAHLVVFLAETGLRFGELQFLTPADLDWRGGRILVRVKKVTGPLHPEMRRLLDRHERWWPKDETNRYVFMTPICYRVLEAVAPSDADHAWVFTNDQGLPVQDQGTRERLQRYATQAGVMLYSPERGKHASKVWSRANWKMFRNYFVSRAASSGMSFVHVMEATGHDSYEMVRHYFRLNEDAYRQDFRKFDSGLSGVDVSCPPLTHESNTLGTQSTREPLWDNDLQTERAGFSALADSSVLG